MAIGTTSVRLARSLLVRMVIRMPLLMRATVAVSVHSLPYCMIRARRFGRRIPVVRLDCVRMVPTAPYQQMVKHNERRQIVDQLVHGTPKRQRHPTPYYRCLTALGTHLPGASYAARIIDKRPA